MATIAGITSLLLLPTCTYNFNDLNLTCTSLKSYSCSTREYFECIFKLQLNTTKAEYQKYTCDKCSIIFFVTRIESNDAVTKCNMLHYWCEVWPFCEADYVR